MADALIGSFIPRSCDHQDTLEGFTFYDSKNTILLLEHYVVCTNNNYHTCTCIMHVQYMYFSLTYHFSWNVH